MHNILVVEDDEVMNRGIQCCLSDKDIDVTGAISCRQAEEFIRSKSFDIFVLDVNLPDGNGFMLCRKIRELFPNVPIIFLSARDYEIDIVKGFNLGADDYITKPFNVTILKKKIRAILRRCSKSIQSIYEVKDLKMDLDRKEVYKNSEKLNLTPSEYRILEILVIGRGKVITKEQFVDSLYDKDGGLIDEHSLSVYISRLRNKIENGEEAFVKTIYGMGYMWCDE